MASRLPDPSSVPVVPFDQWWPRFQRDYRATADHADHVTIFGPPGSGKSTLGLLIASQRPWVAYMGAKPKDRPMRAALRRQGYRMLHELPERGAGVRRVAIWPPNRNEADRARMAGQFRQAFQTAYRRGVWHLYADEGHYLAERLRLADVIADHYYQGRSLGSGVILCAQRPAWLPRIVYSGADHVMMFPTNDSVDLRSLSGLGGTDDRLVRAVVQSLPRDHHFLHINARTRELAVTRLPPSLALGSVA